LAGICKVAGGVYPMPGIAQAARHHVAQHLIVFNPQNAHGWGLGQVSVRQVLR
jgi:cell division ATPase FtsA